MLQVLSFDIYGQSKLMYSQNLKQQICTEIKDYIFYPAEEASSTKNT